MKRFFYALLFIVLLIPLKASAACNHSWFLWDTAQATNGQHKEIYWCYNCDDEKTVLVNCTWKKSDSCKEGIKGQTHLWRYDCDACNAEKWVSEKCTKWEKGYDYDCKEKGKTHYVTYYCKDCDGEKKVVENCTLSKDSNNPNYSASNQHYYWYLCKYCYGDVKKYEKCTKVSEKYYDEIDHVYHYDYSKCKKCSHEFKKKVKHDKFTWHKSPTTKGCFHFGCKKCDFMPKYNGSTLFDFNDADNISFKKKSKTYKMLSPLYYFHKTKNKVSKVTYSKKNICKVTCDKKGRLSFKALKKGKTTVKVKMKSGATYTYKVTIK